MKDFDSLKAEEVLNPDRLEKYQRQLGVLRDDLIFLHSNLRLVGQIKEFDAEFFQAPKALLNYLANRLVTDAVLITTRVWRDRTKGVIGLDRLAKWLVVEGVREEFRDELAARIDLSTPSREVLDSIENMRITRHARLAHLEDQTQAKLSEVPRSFSWSEISAAAQALGVYYNVLAFGTEQIFVLVQFHGASSAWYEGSMGYVLEQIALGSKWFEVLEKHPDLWAEWRRELKPDELAAINTIRKRRRMQELD